MKWWGTVIKWKSFTHRDSKRFWHAYKCDWRSIKLGIKFKQSKVRHTVANSLSKYCIICVWVAESCNSSARFKKEIYQVNCLVLLSGTHRTSKSWALYWNFNRNLLLQSIRIFYCTMCVRTCMLAPLSKTEWEHLKVVVCGFSMMISYCIEIRHSWGLG